MKLIVSYLCSFLNDGFLYALLLSPLYGLYRKTFLQAKYQGRLTISVPVEKETAAVVLFVYIVMLFTQTFIVNSGPNEIKLIPFAVIVSQFFEIWTLYDGWKAFVFNVAGNIGVFVPIGILSTFLFEHDAKQAALNGMLLSVFIEVVQIPLERTTDIDDVILNTIGMMIGYGICTLFKKRAVLQR